MSQREFLSTVQVAEVTGIPPATLRYWRCVNTGPACFKLGSRVVYRQAEVAKWIAEQEEATRRGGAAS